MTPKPPGAVLRSKRVRRDVQTIAVAGDELGSELQVSDAAVDQSSGVLEQMDSSKITPHHWKILFISGMGFFTDAYDLFIIGVVMALLKEQWKVSTVAEGLVT